MWLSIGDATNYDIVISKSIIIIINNIITPIIYIILYLQLFSSLSYYRKPLLLTDT